MNPKLQNTLHWLLIIVLTILAIAPAINGVIHGHLTGEDLIDAIGGVLIAAATKFVYYADTFQGTSIPVTVVPSNVSVGVELPSNTSQNPPSA